MEETNEILEIASYQGQNGRVVNRAPNLHAAETSSNETALVTTLNFAALTASAGFVIDLVDHVKEILDSSDGEVSDYLPALVGSFAGCSISLFLLAYNRALDSQRDGEFELTSRAKLQRMFVLGADCFGIIGCAIQMLGHKLWELPKPDIIAAGIVFTGVASLFVPAAYVAVQGSATVRRKNSYADFFSAEERRGRERCRIIEDEGTAVTVISNHVETSIQFEGDVSETTSLIENTNN